jgi:hypothetical protein
VEVSYVTQVVAIPPMVFLTLPEFGCVFTLSQEDGDELYYAPIYADGNVNLEEFSPVDMDSADMDEMELYDIRNRLIAMCQI